MTEEMKKRVASYLSKLVSTQTVQIVNSDRFKQLVTTEVFGYIRKKRYRERRIFRNIDDVITLTYTEDFVKNYDMTDVVVKNKKVFVCRRQWIQKLKSPFKSEYRITAYNVNEKGEMLPMSQKL